MGAVRLADTISASSCAECRIHVSTWEPAPGETHLGNIYHHFPHTDTGMRPCPPRFSCGGIGQVQGTPEQIVNSVVDWAAGLGTSTGPGEKMSIPAVWRANDAHGSTVTGGRSDHQGPPQFAWAVDIVDPANRDAPTPKKDKIAAALAQAYGIPPTSGSCSTAVWDCASTTIGHYRIQLIYRTYCGGNHYNHVHFGVRRTDMAEPPIPPQLIYPGYTSPAD